MSTPQSGEETGGKLGRFGLYIFLAALALTPILGGTPAGSEYAAATWGGDGMLGALRALVFVAALLASFAPAQAPSPDRIGATARGAVYGTAAWVVLSALVHTHFFTSSVYAFAILPEVLNWLTFATAFALAARFAAEDRRFVRWMATALLAGGIVCAIYGIISFGSVPAADRATHRESAMFFSPNFAAGFGALTLPMAAALFLAADSLIPLILSGAAVGLLFSLIMITGSRAGLVLALIGLAIALVLAMMRRVPIAWARVGILVAVLAVFGFAFRAPIVGRVASGDTAAASADQGEDHSGAFRKETWKGTIAMARAQPIFGAGPGTFPYTYSRYAIVGRSGHAHSSYLQLASESGFPALAAALLGIAAALVFGVRTRLATGDDKSPDVATALLAPALIGGIVAALGRSIFDSEWILLGCAVPFFAALGMLVGSGGSTEDEGRAVSAKPAARVAAIAFAIICLGQTLWLRGRESTRDSLASLAQRDPTGAASEAHDANASLHPGDPDIAAMAQDFDGAAALSPSGKRLYQLARYYERQGDEAKAITEFQASETAEPLNLQTLKALAEAQTKTGNADGAEATYQRMVAVAEGPAGTIRAIPELPDTLPAFAYTALGEDAAKRGDTADAVKNLTTAAKIIDDYSRTPPLYQQSEIVTLGANTLTRRAEIRALYTDQIVPGLTTALKASGRATDADALTHAESDTTARLDAFMKPPTAGSTTNP